MKWIQFFKGNLDEIGDLVVDDFQGVVELLGEVNLYVHLRYYLEVLLRFCVVHEWDVFVEKLVEKDQDLFAPEGASL